VCHWPSSKLCELCKTTLEELADGTDEDADSEDSFSGINGGERQSLGSTVLEVLLVVLHQDITGNECMIRACVPFRFNYDGHSSRSNAEDDCGDN
jgi:hypothetical protein